ncbi:hypothetical protein [Herpetosiphon sp. NSE202]|uniref:hypothetical protein n=1 Tax=Herpetosiphon sp. NSE202 TaxID=3351349 RepID=UPI003627CB1C
MNIYRIGASIVKLVLLIILVCASSLATQAQQPRLLDQPPAEQPQSSVAVDSMAPLTATNLITGTWNSSLNNQLQVPGTIKKLYVDDHDRLYVTGSFNYLNNQEFNGLASWDGNTWQGYGLQPDDRDTIYAMNTYHDQLIVGGEFKTLAGQPRNGIARWNGTAFEGFGSGFQGVSAPYDYSERPKVYDLDVVSDTLYITGSFTSFNQLAVNALLAWQPTGYRKVAEIEGGLYQFSATNSKMLVTGRFSSIGNMGAADFALWQDGAWMNPWVPSWAPWGSETFVLSDTFYTRGYEVYYPFFTSIYRWENNTWVTDSKISEGSAIDLVQWNGQLFSVSNAKLWQRTSFDWSVINLPITIYKIADMAASSTGIYLAGEFEINNQRSQLVFWDGTTVHDVASTFKRETIRSIGNLQGRPIIISGDHNTIQRWNGIAWQYFGQFASDDELITIDNDNTYLAGSSIRRFEPNSNLTTLFIPLIPQTSQINWTVSGSELIGNIYSGTIDYQTTSNIIAIKGKQWRQLLNQNPSSYPLPYIYVVGQKIYSIDNWQSGITLSFWNGTAWQKLTTLPYPNIYIYSLVPQAVTWRGNLYFLYENELRRFDSGSNTLITVARFDDVPLVLRATPEHMYVAGRFTKINNQSIGHMARWNGSTWQGFADAPNGTVEKMAVTSRYIHIGGNFTRVGNIPSLGIASVDLAIYRQYIPQVGK